MKINSEYLYLEHDGKILLVDKHGNGPKIPKFGRIDLSDKDILLRLPDIEEVSKMGIKWIKKRTNIIKNRNDNYNIIFAEPLIEWPENWAWKDNVISDNAVHPIVRECVYRTIHRIVSKVIILNDNDELLMAKVSRGFFTGYWTLPGGFVNYGEHPRKSAEREVFEELGIKIVIPDNNGESGKHIEGEGMALVQEEIFNEDGINWVSFTYRSYSNVEIKDIRPKENEIEEARWFSIEDALEEAVSFFDKSAIKLIKK
jgi:ADP-ribose pyrophosphatase YjhB (NUDIX family)